MSLEDFELGDVPDYASFMFIQVFPDYPQGLGVEGLDERLHVPLGFVFVIDPKFGDRAQYKLPGGHRKPAETPFETAIREARGETGITTHPGRVTYKGKWLGWRRDHWKCLFVASVQEYELREMHDFDAENEGEQPKFFTQEEFYACVRAGKFMREHFEKLEEYALILPLGRDKVA